MSTKQARYQIGQLGRDILAAIDAGARDVYDINVAVHAAAKARGEGPAGTLTTELRLLRTARLIISAWSPLGPGRSAYERAEFHRGPIPHPGAGAYPCGCVFVHDATGAVVQVQTCQPEGTL